MIYSLVYLLTSTCLDFIDRSWDTIVHFLEKFIEKGCLPQFPGCGSSNIHISFDTFDTSGGKEQREKLF